MSIEEAIKILRSLYNVQRLDTLTQEEMTAVAMAIKALEQEPCEDCISRQAVDELSKELVHTTRDKADFLCKFWEGLQKLPPVTPKEKTGHWIDNHTTCDCCGWQMIDDVMESPNMVFFLFCPNCGARMSESQESEDKE